MNRAERRRLQRRQKKGGTALTPAEAQRLFSEADFHLSEGRLDLAEQHYQQLLHADPNNAEVLNMLGVLAGQKNDSAKACQMIRKAIRINPGQASYYNNLGNTLKRRGDLDAAIEAHRQALQIDPDYRDAQLNLAGTLLQAGKLAPAKGMIEHALHLNPADLEMQHLLGLVFIKVLQEALKLEPENAAIHARLAEVRHDQQNYLEARAAITRAIGINPNNAAHYNLLTRILCNMNLTDEAAAMARKAIALCPDAAKYHRSLGVALMMGGNPVEAGHSFRRVIQLQPAYTYAHAMLAEITQHRTHDEDMRAMEALLQDGKLSDQQAINLHFGLGKAFDDLGDYAQAFRHFAQGNTLTGVHSTSEHDAGQYFRAVTETFSADFLQQYPDTGVRGITPLFITGLPRSGKTVLETILARHPMVTAGGESTEYQRLAWEIVDSHTGKNFMDGIRELEAPAFAEIGRAYTKSLQQRFGMVDYATNTSPAMARYIGMIRLCLPDAKIILCMREARDLCTEIYKKNLTKDHYYSYDPLVLGNYYLLHRDLMEHWRQLLPDFIHVVQFEELLRDPENQISALLDYCGLPREEACLETASLPTPTAVTGIWKHYREHLGTLYEMIDA